MNNNELKQIKDIANFLNIKYNTYNLKKLKNLTNAYEISNNLIYFYPINDGWPTCSFKFFKNDKLIISNNNNYSEITNLDDILLNLVRIFNQSLDNKIVLDPYYFMLELTDEIKENYHSTANLLITDATIRNHKINENNIDAASKYFINHFLDHFIGWNFGMSINRNKLLKKELEELNEKVINMGIREYAGPGLEVYGSEYEIHNGLQHYKLPTKKINIKKKIIFK